MFRFQNDFGSIHCKVLGEYIHVNSLKILKEL